MDDVKLPTYAVPTKRPSRLTRPSSLHAGPQLSAVHNTLTEDGPEVDPLMGTTRRLAEAYKALAINDTDESTNF